MRATQASLLACAARKHLIIAACLAVATFGHPDARAARPDQPTVAHPRGCLSASAPAACAALPEPSGSHAWWVFFRDRGGARLTADDMVRIAETLPAETWARRAHSGAPVPDLRDTPLWAPYVSAVAGHGRIRNQSRWLNAVSIQMTGEQKDAVAALPFVREVRPVASGRPESFGPRIGPNGEPLETTLPTLREESLGPYPYGPSYGQLNEINVIPVHALGYTGNRVLLMMLDTGFRKDHNAFRHTRRLAERDFVFHDGNTQNEPVDDPSQQDHGTGTWATNGGYDPGHLVGPAYGATFVLAKTEDVRSETRVEEDNYVAALEWADSLGVALTSASLCYTCFDNGFCYNYPLKDGDYPVISRAIDIAAARGILCVNAAGNYGSDPMTLGTPADADSVISCGAVDSLNNITWFSSRGPSDDGRTKPEVCARGEYTWWANASDPASYGFASGTSLSTPLVSGAAALVLEAHPEWGPMDVRNAFMMTADKHNTPDNAYGWGRIRTLAAIHYGMILYPGPFSLITPADSATVTTFSPTFRWRRAANPDDSGLVYYTLHLREAAQGGPEWTVPAGQDTSLTVSFVLQPSRGYIWNVTAEDPNGHRRTSREDRFFRTSGTTGVEPATAFRLRVDAGPNPSSGAVRFNVRSQAGQPLAWAVYDPAGRRIAGAEGASGLGLYRGTWDGRDGSGVRAPAGIYYLEVRVGAESARSTLVRTAAR